jgi:hypothetical protein
LRRAGRASIGPRTPHIRRRHCERVTAMSKPLIVSIPHRLGREEAARRIKSGFSAARTNYSTFVTFHEEAWTGDRLAFNVSALGQTASGVLDVADDHVRLEVTLPWLLAKVAEKLTPAIRKEATLMLEHKNKKK